MTAGRREEREAAAGWITRELPRLAPAWLVGQRWFGAKSRRIAAVAIDDVLWLGDTLDALVILDVSYAGDGVSAAPRDDRYATLVAARGDDAVGAIMGRLPERTWTMVDAPADPRAVAALLAGLAHATDVRGARGGRLRYADASPAARTELAAGAALRIAPLSAEQSNTSVRIGSTHVFKLFRRLEDGVHPQLEVSRQLASRGFVATPSLEGTLVYERGDVQRAIGALEGWIDNSGDGWRYVVGRLATARPGSPEAGRLAADLAHLGTITADFHLALSADAAQPDFAPEPVREQDVQRWRDDARAQAAATLDLIARRHDAWPAGGRAAAAAVLEQRSRLADVLPSLDTEGFHRIRIHGDYHLGQVLKTADGFVILDFEGEPAKPLAVRRSKHCALKDVAGMLRSFDYATATAVPPADRAATVAWMRAAFLDAYLERARGSAALFLPASGGDVAALIDLFEMEKAFYEVDYEANNRPDWLHIPLSAVARLCRGNGDPASERGPAPRPREAE